MIKINAIKNIVKNILNEIENKNHNLNFFLNYETITKCAEGDSQPIGFGIYSGIDPLILYRDDPESIDDLKKYKMKSVDALGDVLSTGSEPFGAIFSYLFLQYPDASTGRQVSTYPIGLMYLPPTNYILDNILGKDRTLYRQRITLPFRSKYTHLGSSKEFPLLYSAQKKFENVSEGNVHLPSLFNLMSETDINWIHEIGANIGEKEVERVNDVVYGKLPIFLSPQAYPPLSYSVYERPNPDLQSLILTYFTPSVKHKITDFLAYKLRRGERNLGFLETANQIIDRNLGEDISRLTPWRRIGSEGFEMMSLIYFLKFSGLALEGIKRIPILKILSYGKGVPFLFSEFMAIGLANRYLNELLLPDAGYNVEVSDKFLIPSASEIYDYYLYRKLNPLIHSSSGGIVFIGPATLISELKQLAVLRSSSKLRELEFQNKLFGDEKQFKIMTIVLRPLHTLSVIAPDQTKQFMSLVLLDNKTLDEQFEKLIRGEKSDLDVIDEIAHGIADSIILHKILNWNYNSMRYKYKNPFLNDLFDEREKIKLKILDGIFSDVKKLKKEYGFMDEKKESTIINLYKENGDYNHKIKVLKELIRETKNEVRTNHNIDKDKLSLINDELHSYLVSLYNIEADDARFRKYLEFNERIKSQFFTVDEDELRQILIKLNSDYIKTGRTWLKNFKEDIRDVLTDIGMEIDDRIFKDDKTPEDFYKDLKDTIKLNLLLILKNKKNVHRALKKEGIDVDEINFDKIFNEESYLDNLSSILSPTAMLKDKNINILIDPEIRWKTNNVSEQGKITSIGRSRDNFLFTILSRYKFNGQEWTPDQIKDLLEMNEYRNSVAVVYFVHKGTPIAQLELYPSDTSKLSLDKVLAFLQKSFKDGLGDPYSRLQGLFAETRYKKLSESNIGLFEELSDAVSSTTKFENFKYLERAAIERFSEKLNGKYQFSIYPTILDYDNFSGWRKGIIKNFIDQTKGIRGDLEFLSKTILNREEVNFVLSKIEKEISRILNSDDQKLKETIPGLNFASQLIITKSEIGKYSKRLLNLMDGIENNNISIVEFYDALEGLIRNNIRYNEIISAYYSILPNNVKEDIKNTLDLQENNEQKEILLYKIIERSILVSIEHNKNIIGDKKVSELLKTIESGNYYFPRNFKTSLQRLNSNLIEEYYRINNQIKKLMSGLEINPDLFLTNFGRDENGNYNGVVASQLSENAFTKSSADWWINRYKPLKNAGRVLSFYIITN